MIRKTIIFTSLLYALTGIFFAPTTTQAQSSIVTRFDWFCVESCGSNTRSSSGSKFSNPGGTVNFTADSVNYTVHVHITGTYTYVSGGDGQPCYGGQVWYFGSTIEVNGHPGANHEGNFNPGVGASSCDAASTQSAITTLDYYISCYPGNYSIDYSKLIMNHNEAGSFSGLTGWIDVPNGHLPATATPTAAPAASSTPGWFDPGTNYCYNILTTPSPAVSPWPTFSVPTLRVGTFAPWVTATTGGGTPFTAGYVPTERPDFTSAPPPTAIPPPSVTPTLQPSATPNCTPRTNKPAPDPIVTIDPIVLRPGTCYIIFPGIPKVEIAEQTLLLWTIPHTVIQAPAIELCFDYIHIKATILNIDIGSAVDIFLTLNVIFMIMTPFRKEL